MGVRVEDVHEGARVGEGRVRRCRISRKSVSKKSVRL